MIILRTIYVFKINKNYIKLVIKKPEKYYILLKTIYNYKKKDIEVAFNFFNEICRAINKSFYNKYIYERLKNDDAYSRFIDTHMYHDYFREEESKMNIYNSYIKIKSNKANNIFLNNLKELTDLFVCDFINDYYELYNKNSVNIFKKK